VNYVALDILNRQESLKPDRGGIKETAMGASEAVDCCLSDGIGVSAVGVTHGDDVQNAPAPQGPSEIQESGNTPIGFVTAESGHNPNNSQHG
jgi:hypothetical protein